LQMRSVSRMRKCHLVNWVQHLRRKVNCLTRRSLLRVV
ncbi:acrB/AcrD/AcrF family protein, partial [Vibrio parahaemolyticus V-223/04]